MKLYKLAAMLLALAVLAMSLTACKRISTENESNTADNTSMFVEVEKTNNWRVVYNKRTRVMYAVSFGAYNSGNFTLLVNADGSPMLYDGQ
jgi:hypothetical protein